MFPVGSLFSCRSIDSNAEVTSDKHCSWNDVKRLNDRRKNHPMAKAEALNFCDRMLCLLPSVSRVRVSGGKFAGDCIRVFGPATALSCSLEHHMFEQ